MVTAAQPAGCGVNGALVTFTVGGVPASATVLFTSGDTVSVALTIGIGSGG